MLSVEESHGVLRQPARDPRRSASGPMQLHRTGGQLLAPPALGRFPWFAFFLDRSLRLTVSSTWLPRLSAQAILVWAGTSE